MIMTTHLSLLVPHRKPGPVRAGDPCAGRAAVPCPGRSAQRRRHSAGAGGVEAGAHRLQPPSTQMIMAANADPDCIGLIAWMHTFSPAKMWITGLDALKTPFLHLHTQANVSLPWAEIDMDFMNLNQAAHGDREFGYIQTRLGVPRTTVAGHVSDPTTQSRIAGWQRAARGVAAVRNSEAGPVRRQHAQRRGHRGRQGRGRAAVRRVGEHLRRQRPGRARRRRQRCRGG